MITCPKCDADISDTFQEADPSVGIMSGGYYCDDCDCGVADWEAHEPSPDNVPISFVESGKPLGTPFTELASQPGDTPEQRAKYENFKRIAKSWGYD